MTAVVSKRQKFWHFFFFLDSSRAFQSITSFYTLSISSVASVWIFMVHWIFLLWPHRKKKKHKKPLLFCILRRRLYVGRCYVSSPFVPSCDFRGHASTRSQRIPPPPPPRTSSPPALVRMRSLSLSPARRHRWQGRVIRQRRGIKPCGAHGKYSDKRKKKDKKNKLEILFDQ